MRCERFRPFLEPGSGRWSEKSTSIARRMVKLYIWTDENVA
jgi:hypothetical protein